MRDMGRARPTNDELNERRISPPGTRDELRKQLEALVTRWEWATGCKYGFQPYSTQLAGHMYWGKTLKTAPADPTDHYEFGFDDEGRLLIERCHSKSNGLQEEFIIWGERFVRSYSYRAGKIEDHCSRRSILVRTLLHA